MWRLPLCTPKVSPTISGVMVERRDQVRITCGLCEPARIRSTTFRMPLSTQAPFFNERGIGFPFRISKLLDSPIPHNHLLRAFVPARFVTAGRLAPGRYRIAAAGGLAFTTTVRMVHRIHRDAADVRPDSLPTRSPGFAQRDILMLDVAYLAHSRAALNRHAPHFAGGHAQLCELAFLGQELRERSGCARHLSAFAGAQFDVVNLRAQRNAANWQSVPGKNICFLTTRDHFPHFQSDRSDDVAFFSVQISQQSNVRRAIRIVFDLSNARRHAVLVALEIDHSVETFVTAATTSHRN